MRRAARAARLGTLPEKVRDVAQAFSYGPLTENPRRAGAPLIAPYEGQDRAVRGRTGSRTASSTTGWVVEVVRVAHRSDVHRR